MKENSNKEEQGNQNLPLGTCSLKYYKKIEAIKVALCSPYNQYIVFSSDIRNFSWIIIKQTMEKNQPIYHLYSQTLKKRFLSAQKQPNNIGCNFLISKIQKPQKDSQFVGKVRGNFRNTEFMIYDNGQNPKKNNARKRKQFGSVKYYEESIFSKDKFDNLQIIIPQVRQVNQQFNICPKYLPKEFTPNEEKQNILYEQSQINSQNVIKIAEVSQQTTSKSEKINKLVLNLLEKKINIKLKIKSNINNQPIFQLNTRGKSTFFMRFSHPFSIVQSFGIVLSIIEKTLS